MQTHLPLISPTGARRARAAVASDATAGHDAATLLRRVRRSIQDVVPFTASVLTTTDPDTLLWTGGVTSGLPAGAMAQCIELGLDDDDAAVPFGLGPALRVTFTSGGRCFGTACLLREEGAAEFDPREAAFLREVATDVGEGLRAALSLRRTGAAADHAAGVLVVDDGRRVLSATDAAAAWLAELGADAGEIPAIVHAVVVRARERAAGAVLPPARARAVTPSGAWVSVHASVLSGDQRAWAVVLEPACRGDVLPLVGEAHDLTPREQEVLGLLLCGLPDKAVAEELVVSRHTAREHASRVLRKFGVRSRAELQALLYHERYAPSLRA